MDSILDSIKKIVGITPDCVDFDDEIIPAINTSFYRLWTLGIGRDKKKPFKIEDNSSVWSDFIDDTIMETVKSFVGLEVRLLFDPPTNSFLVTAIKDQIDKYEFLMTVGEDEYRLADE